MNMSAMEWMVPCKSFVNLKSNTGWDACGILRLPLRLPSEDSIDENCLSKKEDQSHRHQHGMVVESLRWVLPGKSAIIESAHPYRNAKNGGDSCKN